MVRTLPTTVKRGRGGAAAAASSNSLPGRSSSLMDTISHRKYQVAPIFFVLILSLSFSLDFVREFRSLGGLVEIKSMNNNNNNNNNTISSASASTTSTSTLTTSLRRTTATNYTITTVVNARQNVTTPGSLVLEEEGSSVVTTPQELQQPHVPLLASSNNSATNRYSHLTNGAFVHLGKTGGSTLSLQLRNGCHSFVKKPCADRLELVHSPNETVASKRVSHYYHVPDFPKLPNDPTRPFYILTLRDPLERTKSAFVYLHPLNVQAVGLKFNPWAPMLRHHYNQSLAALTQCYETLEAFVQNLGDGDQVHNFSYPYHHIAGAIKERMYQNDCQQFARAVLNHKVPPLEHLYYNIGHMKELLSPHLMNNNTNSVLFVTRKEHLMQDWIGINKLLGQGQQTNDRPIYQPQQHMRDVSQLQLPVPNELSETGRIQLCKALRQEYKDYIALLKSAVNLTPQDVANSMTMARTNCPELQLS